MHAVDVQIPVDFVTLEGTLTIPDGARAIVVFVHGGGSSRLSPRNLQTAATFQQAGIATLLFDLLTENERVHDDVTREYRFNIPFLARRLLATLEWLHTRDDVSQLAIGLFGASTGAAAALAAAAKAPAVKAVVSRGGRPDLARDALCAVAAPTLMIVGSLDAEVLRFNRKAAEQMVCRRQIEVVEGASHLFEESGTLEAAERLALQWFDSWLVDVHER